MTAEDAGPSPDPLLKPRKSALRQLMDLLAKRPHSETELRLKLLRQHSENEVDDALHVAREKRWLTDPTDLARSAYAELSRKKKGYAFIQRFLDEKGLPGVAFDAGFEIQKARALVGAKLAKLNPLDYEERMRMTRLLLNRGFAEETIRDVVGEFSEFAGD